MRPTRLFSRNADVNAVNKQELAVRDCTRAVAHKAHSPAQPHWHGGCWLAQSGCTGTICCRLTRQQLSGIM